MTFACSFDAGASLKDLDDKVDEAVKDVDLNIKICGDQTLEDLIHGDTLSDECRKKVESHLPKPASSFASRIVVLGTASRDGGGTTLYVVGADADGKALFDGAPSDVKVHWDIGAETSQLIEVEGDVEVTLKLPEDVFSIGIVNDYSGSMRDEDLANVSEIETDILTILPPVHETEVTQFSEAVTVVQPFTEDKDALLAAVDIDHEYERSSTALLDGVGTALDRLIARERPVKLLIVSTDGAENASTKYEESDIINKANAHHVPIIMLGALFAHVPTLKRLSADRGVFFYARDYRALKSAVRGFIESLGQIVAIHLPPKPADAMRVVVEANGQTGAYDFGPF